MKKTNQESESILIYHNYVQPHTFLAIHQEIHKLGWSVVPHPPYSPDLVPLNFHLFSPVKDSLCGQWSDNTDVVTVVVMKWVKQCTHEFLQRELKRWIQQWHKYIICHGDYVEQYNRGRFSLDTCVIWTTYIR